MWLSSDGQKFGQDIAEILNKNNTQIGDKYQYMIAQSDAQDAFTKYIRDDNEELSRVRVN